MQGADTPLLVIGAGGHAKVLVGCLLRLKRRVLGLLDSDVAKHGQRVLGVEILGGDSHLAGYPKMEVGLVNGIGSVDVPTLRHEVFSRLSQTGYIFPPIVDPSAFVSPDAELGPGCQVLAGAVLQVGVRIGDNAIINTGAVIDHDTEIGPHSHIAPGVKISGSVRIGRGCHIGIGAAVIQGVRIGDGALVAAGAAVVSDVAANTRVRGVPAHPW